MSKELLVVERPARSVTMTRVFDGPRELIWKIYTDPQLVPSWWGLRLHTTVVDRMEVKPGGKWRFIEKDAQGNTFAFNGVYQEVTPPERLVYTFEYEPMAGHISTDTVIFAALPDGKTRITATTTFTSLEDLEGMLQSGMESGANESWDRLEEVLVKARKEKVK